MNGQNNGKLKKAIIICGVFVVLILALYIGSVFINGNVVKKMNGKMLYIVRENSGDTVYMYDFDEKTNEKIDNGEDAVYYGDMVAYINDNAIYTHSDEKDNRLFVLGEGTFKKITATKKILAAVTSGESDAIIGIDEDNQKTTIAEGYDNIIDICSDGNNIFFAAQEKNKITIYETGISSQTAAKLFQTDMTDNLTIDYYDEKIYITEYEDGKKRAAVYNIKTEKATLLKFSTTEFNVESFVPVTESKFVALCDKKDDYLLYVCNGSNMVEVDALHDLDIIAVTNYTN